MGIGEVTKAVFLDRDGVLNLPVVRDGKPYPPASVDDLRIYPDAWDALTSLKRAGYLLIVVTNQPDVARGTQTSAGLSAIHAAIGATLPIDQFVVCAHEDADGCECRKPRPGMVLTAAAEHHVDLERSFLIGDRWRDIECGAAAGVRSVLLERNYRERKSSVPPAFVTTSISEAAAWILNITGDIDR
jgi:D-glycero-D-manno-heptose 1,7-bisphosphate phosphatase